MRNVCLSMIIYLRILPQSQDQELHLTINFTGFAGLMLSVFSILCLPCISANFFHSFFYMAEGFSLIVILERIHGQHFPFWSTSYLFTPWSVWPPIPPQRLIFQNCINCSCFLTVSNAGLLPQSLLSKSPNPSLPNWDDPQVPLGSIFLGVYLQQAKYT